MNMASFNAEIEWRIAELRREILSHRPVKVSRLRQRLGDDPDGLTLGLVDLGECGSSVVTAMRSALMNYPDHQQSSHGDRIEYLSSSLSVISRSISCRDTVISRESISIILQELAERTGVFILVVRASLVPYFTNDVIKLTKHITGRLPISIILCDARRNDVDKLIEYLRNNDITDIYELSDEIDSNRTMMISNEEQWGLLNIVRRCLLNSDEITHAVQQFPMNRDETAHAFERYPVNSDEMAPTFQPYPVNSDEMAHAFQRFSINSGDEICNYAQPCQRYQVDEITTTEQITEKMKDVYI